MSFKTKTVNPTNLKIDYYRLKPEDFNDAFVVEDNAVQKLELNEKDYIGDSLIGAIDLDEKNTVVVNCGVGQGKSTAAVKLAEGFYQQLNSNGTHKYVVIFAALYKAIISDYYKRLSDLIGNDRDIFDYQNLNKDNFNQQFNKHIHLVTAQTLLGNYGEDAFMQKEIKRNYLESIVRHCEKTGKKAVFFFDEVHDFTSSFEQKFIFNLWKWHKVLHKAFVISCNIYYLI